MIKFAEDLVTGKEVNRIRLYKVWFFSIKTRKEQSFETASEKSSQLSEILLLGVGI